MIGVGHSHSAAILCTSQFSKPALYVWGSNSRMQLTRFCKDSYNQLKPFSPSQIQIPLIHKQTSYVPVWISCGAYNTYVVAVKQWSNPMSLSAFAHIKEALHGQSLESFFDRSQKMNKLLMNYKNQYVIQQTQFSQLFDNLSVDNDDISAARDQIFSNKDVMSVKAVQDYIIGNHSEYGRLFMFGYLQGDYGMKKVNNQEGKQRCQGDDIFDQKNYKSNKGKYQNQSGKKNPGGQQKNKRINAHEISFKEISFNLDQSQIQSSRLIQHNKVEKQRQQFDDIQGYQSKQQDSGKIMDSPRVVKMPKSCFPIVKVACGLHHTLALSKTGQLLSWGDGRSFGQLGTGKRQILYMPTFIQIFQQVSKQRQSIIQIACGSNHSLAISDKFNLYAWGRGANGRLGTGTKDDIYAPTQLSHISKLRPEKISCGDAHSACIVAKEKLFTWGMGGYGRLGHGDQMDRYVPQMVSELSNYDVINVSCGAFHTIAITRRGRLYSFGLVREGRLGIPDSKLVRSKFLSNPLHIKMLNQTQDDFKFKFAIAGFRHNIAISSARDVDNKKIKYQLMSWGFNGFGLLGRRDNPDIPKRIKDLHLKGPQLRTYIPNLQFELTQDKYGGQDVGLITPRKKDCQNTGAIKSNEIQSFKKKQSKQDITLIVQSKCSQFNTVCKNAAGQVYIIGSGSYGQRGIDPTQLFQNVIRRFSSQVDPLKAPIKIQPFGSLPKNKAKTIACGDGHIIVVTLNGQVYTWGKNQCGQLGNGKTTSYVYRPEPIQLYQAKYCYAREDYSAILNEFGELFTFGSNQYGKLGLCYSSSQSVIIPTKVPIPIVQSVACGPMHMIAIMRNSQENNSQRDGNGVTARQNDQDNIQRQNKLVIGNGNQDQPLIYAWGRGSYGQLGAGVVNSTSKPLPLSSRIYFKKVSCGLNFSVGVTHEGDVYFWGQQKFFPGRRRELNNNSSSNNANNNQAYSNLLSLKVENDIVTPTIVPIMFGKVIDISASERRVYAIIERRQIIYWGEKTGAQKKAIDVDPFFIIEKRSSQDNNQNAYFERVQAGPTHCTFVSTCHNLYVWGQNRHGRLGFPQQQDKKTRKLQNKIKDHDIDKNKQSKENSQNKLVPSHVLGPTKVKSLKSKIQSRLKNKGASNNLNSDQANDFDEQRKTLNRKMNQLDQGQSSPSNIIQSKSKGKSINTIDKDPGAGGDVYELQSNLDLIPILLKARDIQIQLKQNLKQSLEEQYLLKIDDFNNQIFYRIFKSFKRIGQIKERQRVSNMNIQSAFITRIQQAPFKMCTKIFDPAKHYPMWLLQNKKRFQQILTLIHIHPCYLMNIYAAKCVESSFLWELTKQLYGFSFENKRKLLFLTSLAKIVFQKDIEQKVDLLNQRNYFWLIFDYLMMNNDQNIRYFAIIIGTLVNTVSKERGRDQTKNALVISGKFIENLRRQYVADNAFNQQMKIRSGYLEQKVREITQNIIKGKLLSLDASDGQDGFGVGKIPNQPIERGVKELVSQNHLTSHPSVFYVSITTSIQKFLALIMKRLSLCYKDSKFYLSKLYTKQSIDIKVKDHRENLRSFGQVFLAFVSGSDLALKDQKGTWLSDFNRSLKSQSRQIRARLLNSLIDHKSLTSLPLSIFAQQVKHSNSCQIGTKILMKVSTIERLGNVLYRNIDKIAYLGNKAADQLYYLIKDYGQVIKKIESTRLQDQANKLYDQVQQQDQKAKQEPQTKQITQMDKISLTIQTQVMLEQKEVAYCDHCGSSLAYIHLSSSAQSYTQRYDPMDPYLLHSQFSAILANSELINISTTFINFFVSQIKKARKQQNFSHLNRVQGFLKNIGVDFRGQKIIKRGGDIQRKEARLFQQLLFQVEQNLTVRMLHQRSQQIVTKKLLKIEQSMRETNLKPKTWYESIIQKIRFGVDDNNLLKFSKSVISLGMTKKIKSSIQNRPMSNNLFENLNFQEKQCIKGYTSRNLKSLIKSNVILTIRIKQHIQKSCEVIIQQMQNDNYQMSITYKRKAKNPICGGSAGGLNSYTSKKIQLLYKTILTSQFLLNLKREVHMKTQLWSQGREQKKKQIKNKKKRQKDNDQEQFNDMNDMDQYFWIDRFICVNKEKFNDLISMIEGSKLAYVQNTAKPEDVRLQDSNDDNDDDDNDDDVDGDQDDNLRRGNINQEFNEIDQEKDFKKFFIENS